MSTTRYCNYSKLLRRSKYRLACPSCSFQDRAREVEKHIWKSHCSSSSNACMWCFNRYSWRSGQKMQHAEHLDKCFNEFAKRNLVIDTRIQSNLYLHLGEYQLKFWNETVAFCETKIQCDRCRTAWVLPKHFECHYEDMHPDVNVKKRCVFCDGKYEGKDANHLTKCFELKKQQSSIEEEEQYSFSLVMDMTPQCPAGDMFGRESPPATAEDDEIFFCLGEEEDQQVKFCGNVDIARRYVSWYCSSSSEEEERYWYHVMVRRVVLNKFYKVIRDNRSSTFLLRYFWCWCDGGSHSSVEVRHHRHMILVTTDPHFMSRAWKNKIAVTAKGDESYHCKKALQLKTAWHLWNTINYVSKRESRCQFSYEGKGPAGLYHYCIGAELPKIAKICMATCTRDGLSQYLVERFGHVSSLTLMKDAVLNRDGKWQIRASILFREDEMGYVLPVEKNWRPCDDESSPYFIWLMNGKKLYFEKCEEVVEKEQQAAGGNVLYKIFDDFWILPPSKQKELSVLFAKQRENSRLQIENNRLRVDEEGERETMMETMSDLRKECMKWKREALNLRSKVSKLKKAKKDDELEFENTIKLQLDIIRLRNELKAVKTENENLRKELLKPL